MILSKHFTKPNSGDFSAAVQIAKTSMKSSWCPRRYSKPHALRRRILNPAMKTRISPENMAISRGAVLQKPDLFRVNEARNSQSEWVV